MANNESSSAVTGVGFTGLLTLIFIVLKLTKVIDWSWLWVLSPLWIPASVALVLIIILVIIKALIR